MWFLRRPADEVVHAFLKGQQNRAFSYAEVGYTRDRLLPGYCHDHNRVRLGQGPGVFKAACDALRQWRMFPSAWTSVHPGSIATVGHDVAVLAHTMGLWWLNACRVVYVIDEPGPSRRFGFAYGTLPGHVERGEERFLVEEDSEGAVWYDLRAFSRPNAWHVRLAYPLARQQQRRFARDSLASMKRAVEAR